MRPFTKDEQKQIKRLSKQPSVGQVERVFMPDICSSMSGCSPPQKHCKECSHSYHFGSIVVNGKEHKFEFNPQYGVMFLKKDGEPRKRQPLEKNPVWDEFSRWHDEKFNEDNC